MRAVEKVMRAMETGCPWHMASATYAYSRACGLTIPESLHGAAVLFFYYLTRSQPHDPRPRA